jgi:alpha-tubulin suppressor-like RCC1 family protein
MPTFYNFTQDGLTYSFDDIFVKADLFRQGNLWNWGRGVAGALGDGFSNSFRSTPITTFVGGSNWKQISTGGQHTVAVKTDGTLWVWGYNNRGQLGNASITDRSTPVTTFAGGNDWKQAEGGTSHTVAIKTDGTLWSWGMNDQGQLGVNARDNSSPFSRSTPVTTFVGGTNWKQASAGYQYSAAIKTDGTLWTWGYAYFGQLGKGGFYTLVRSTPMTTFAGGNNWADTSDTYSPEDLYTIGGGTFFNLAVKNNGTLWTWGYGYRGQLGNATIATNISTPITTFSGGTNWKEISAGNDHVAAIKTDGTLWVWGYANNGQLGTSDLIPQRSTPITTFAGGTNWKQISSGNNNTAAIKTDGTLWTWGGGFSGELGNADTTLRSTPITTFTGGTDWKQVSVGSGHLIAIKTDGTLWTWGNSNFGQLGNASSVKTSTPVTTFAGGTNWKQVSAGLYSSTAIKTDGTLWTWGMGSNGKLGTNQVSSSSTPVTTFAGGTNWKQVSSGGYHTSAVKTDGTLWTWGFNLYGQIGNASVNQSLTPVTTFIGGTDWKQVYSSWQSTLAIKDDGFNTRLYLFGRNYNAELGNKDIGTITGNISTPVTTFAGGTDWATVETDLYTLSAGGSSSSAIKTDGTLWTWGNNGRGQLGNGSTTNRSTPITTFAGGTNWIQVSSTSQHSAAIKTDGTLWTWGNGTFGRLGNAVTTNASTPVTTFAGGTNWKQVSCRDDTTVAAHTAAIKTDGTLWVWGFGGNGRLGNGVTNFSGTSTPITTFAGGSDWKQVSCGFTYTVAIKTNGTLWAWGTCQNGALGNGVITGNISTPITTFTGGTNWRQVSAGFDTTSAIKTDGTLWVWGSGGRGTLGNGITANGRSTPITTFAGGTNWRQVSAGSQHIAAVKTDGTLWTWGYTKGGQLGIGYGAYDFGSTIEYNVRSTPVTTFVGGSNWKQVSAGGQHTVALNDDGANKRLYTWGYNRDNQIGDSFFVEINDAPGKVGDSSNWKQVSCSYHSTAALKTDGTLWTWGDNAQGQLGTAQLFKGSAEPITTFAGGTDWKQVSAGGYYSVNMMAAIKNDATLWTWGNSYLGILGNTKSPLSTAPETELYVSTPITTFAGGIDWKQVSAGGYHMSAVKTNGTLWTWGSGTQYQLGIGYDPLQPSRSTPVTTFAGGTNWKSVGSSGGYNVSAIQYNDILTNPPDVFRLFTWGYGFTAALGNASDASNSSVPITTFAGGSNWRQVSVARDVTCAIKTDGTLWIWGDAASGLLGNGLTTGFISTPITTFSGGTNWKQVSIETYHAAAIKTDGTLWTWGEGFAGYLGTNDLNDRSTPVTTFAGGTNWKQVSSGRYHVAAIKTDGTLWTWGGNADGELGNASTSNTSISTPITTFAGGTNWKQVAGGYAHTAAIKTDGTLWTWGLGQDGRIGNAVITNTSVSTPVTTFAGGTNWEQVSCGSLHVAAIKTDGTLWTWGGTASGALGDGTASFLIGRSTPITTFAGGTNWKQIGAGGYCTAAIKTDGTLWTWGVGDDGRLGNRVTTGDISTPVTTFAGGTNWESLECGYNRVGTIRKN